MDVTRGRAVIITATSYNWARGTELDNGRIGVLVDQSSDAVGSPWLIRSITDESVSVVTSPSSRCSATSFSRRRMILPERVFGSSGTIMIWRGLAIAPIWLATWL